MATHINRLTTRAVEALRTPGRHPDGGNLYLTVSATGAKSWLFIYRVHGRQPELGLGSTTAASLAEARKTAARYRQMLAEGQDPASIHKRKAAEVVTFGTLADQFIDGMESAWRNPKHRAQWRMTLTEYAAPLRPIAVDKVTTEDVLHALRPIWSTKPETATRVRGRIEAVLDAAKAKGLRTGDNPARWRGHLDKLLPRRQKLSRGHHAAMPFDDMPVFMETLRAADGVSPRALEFAILTAARSGEVLGAGWPEIDIAAKVWTVPGERMKAGKEHRVPLPPRAIEILAQMLAVKVSDFVFPGARQGRPLSVMALDMTLRRLGAGDATTHGFRSSFRDWAGERTTFAREVAEAALAHVVGNAVEQAYRRGDALEKRRKLLDAWSSYCGTGDRAKVVPIRKAG